MSALGRRRAGGAPARPRSAVQRLLLTLRVVAVVAALILLLHGLDLRQAGAALATAEPRWLLLGLLLSFGSVAITAVIWGMLVHATNSRVAWSWIAAWHGRALLAGQVIPTGTAGDAVRIVGGRRVVGTGPAVASTLVTRLVGGLGLVAWALLGTFLLRDELGRQTVVIAGCLAATLVVVGVLLLTADLWVGVCANRRSRLAQRLHGWLDPIATTLGRYRGQGSLVVQCLLLGIASWGLNLAALTAVAHAVRGDVGWQVFAVVVPLTLTATLAPFSVNGIGLREGILIGLLGQAGVAAAPAAALAILVDIQMLPFAALGGLLWLTGAGDADPRPAAVPVLEPVRLPVKP